MWVSTAAIRVIGRSPAKNLNFTQRLSLSFDALHRQLSAHCSRQSWFPCRWSPLHEHLDRSARSVHPAWPERRSPASDQGKFNRLSALPQGQSAAGLTSTGRSSLLTRRWRKADSNRRSLPVNELVSQA